MTDHHIHPDPAVRALVERAKAEALREAAAEVPDKSVRFAVHDMTRVPPRVTYVAPADWLRARADSLAAQPAPEAATVERPTRRIDMDPCADNDPDVYATVEAELATTTAELARAWDEGAHFAASHAAIHSVHGRVEGNPYRRRKP